MKRVYLLCMFSFAFFFLGVKQVQGQKTWKTFGNDSDNTIVFGKTYTKEELRNMNGVVRCGTTEYEQYLQERYPARMTDAEFEAWLAPLIQNNAAKSQSGGIVTIPVVVHVIHSGEPVGVEPNITDSQVISQITVLNNDYRKKVGTPGHNTSPVGADTMIQFELAKVDPNGNPTNGIDRVNLCQYAWSTTQIDAIVKPQTIWDPAQYMNMWSVRFSSGSLLGYAQFPTGAGIPMYPGGPANTDGVVSGFANFGSSDYDDGTFLLQAGYDKGRTMTHEVGHFLGLHHIWGDTADCTVDATDSYNDFCLDTPAASAPNYNCTTIDSCPLDPGNDMIQNYMDYTPDGCMNIVTINQKDRITAVMNNALRRATLKTSTKDIAIPLFANDAAITLESECGENFTCSHRYKKMKLHNTGTSALTSATINISVGSNTSTYNWTGNLASNKTEVIEVPVPLSFTSGSMTMQVTNANGAADQRASNNTATFAYTATTVPNTSSNNFVLNLQTDNYGSEVTWTLKNSAGVTMYSGGPYANSGTLPAPVTQNWTLPTGCYTFTINDAYGDGIYNYGGSVNIQTSTGTTVMNGYTYGSTMYKTFTVGNLGTDEVSQNQFEIYPNPVSDILNITKVSNRATFQIVDAAGRLVKSGNIKDNKVNVSELLKGNYIISVSEADFTQNFKFIKK